MKSVVIESPGKLVLAERPLPKPEPHEVRIKVNYAGICGSDVHIYHGNNPFARYPRVIGHEFFGEIDAVGSRVTTKKVGDRVVVDPVNSCGHCYPCSVNKPNVCTSLVVTGVHRDGGFSEYVCIPEQNVYTVPDSISDKDAVMIEPFTIAANITSQLQPKAQDIALIYGAGPMGLTTIQVLKNVYHVSRIIVADFLDERLELAKQNGADDVINNRQDKLADVFAQLEIKPTLIVDAACHPSILNEAISLASPAARIGIMGFSQEPCTIVQQGITSKELTIYSSRLNSHRFPLVINWLGNKLIQPEKLVTHQFPLEQVETALEVFEKDQRSCCKVLLRFT